MEELLPDLLSTWVKTSPETLVLRVARNSRTGHARLAPFSAAPGKQPLVLVKNELPFCRPGGRFTCPYMRMLSEFGCENRIYLIIQIYEIINT